MQSQKADFFQVLLRCNFPGQEPDLHRAKVTVATEVDFLNPKSPGSLPVAPVGLQAPSTLPEMRRTVMERRETFPYV